MHMHMNVYDVSSVIVLVDTCAPTTGATAETASVRDGGVLTQGYLKKRKYEDVDK